MTHRPTKDAGERVWLRPLDLHVDSRVQRPIRVGHVKDIASRFDPALANPVQVSLRSDGRYYVMDGQHTVAAAIAAGRAEKPVECVVWRDLELAEEATKFVTMNDGRKAVDKLSLFNARVVSGEKIAVAINDIVKRLGLSIPRTTGGGDGQIYAVSALEKAYVGTAASGPDKTLLMITLATLKSAWGRDRGAYEGHLISGVASFLAKHRGVNTDDFARKLAKSGTPALVSGKIDTLAKLKKSKRDSAAIEVFEGIYNTKLRMGRLA